MHCSVIEESKPKFKIVNVLQNQNLMNYKVGERSEPKKLKYYKSYTKKRYIIEKIWIYCIYCINIKMEVIVYCISKVLYSIRSVLLYHIVYFFPTYCTYCTYCIFWPRCIKYG